MGISEQEFEQANQRAKTTNSLFPSVVSVRYDLRIHRVVVSLASGLELAFSPKLAEGLENAHPSDLANAEISPSGLGIHFPHIDADIYLPALLEGFLGSKKWMASEIGKDGGKASSKAKTAAARENGKLGGRPRKKEPVAA